MANNTATEMWLKTAENMFERMAASPQARPTLQEVLPRPSIPHTRASEVKVATQGAEAMHAVAATLRVNREMLHELRTQIEVNGRNEH